MRSAMAVWGLQQLIRNGSYFRGRNSKDAHRRVLGLHRNATEFGPSGLPEGGLTAKANARTHFGLLDYMLRGFHRRANATWVRPLGLN